MHLKFLYFEKRRLKWKIKSFNDRGARFQNETCKHLHFRMHGYSLNYVWRAYVRLKKDKLNSLYNFTPCVTWVFCTLWNLKPVGEDRYWNFPSVKSYFHEWRIVEELCETRSALLKSSLSPRWIGYSFFLPFSLWQSTVVIRTLQARRELSEGIRAGNRDFIRASRRKLPRF